MTWSAERHELADTTVGLRDSIANFDDFFRPIRNYFYWEPHCFDIPICWSLRSIFDALDGIDTVTDKLQGLTGDLDHLDQLLPQMLADSPADHRIDEDDARLHAVDAQHDGGHPGPHAGKCARAPR